MSLRERQVGNDLCAIRNVRVTARILDGNRSSALRCKFRMLDWKRDPFALRKGYGHLAVRLLVEQCEQGCRGGSCGGGASCQADTLRKEVAPQQSLDGATKSYGSLNGDGSRIRDLCPSNDQHGDA